MRTNCEIQATGCERPKAKTSPYTAASLHLALAAWIALNVAIPARSETETISGQRGTPGVASRGDSVRLEHLARTESEETDRRDETTGRTAERSRFAGQRSTLAVRNATSTAQAGAADSFAAAGFEEASIPPSPPASASFAGVLDDGTRYNPDTHGAVGPNHIMTVVQSSVRIHDRSGVPLSTVSMGAFWAGVGGAVIYDPRVVYDPLGQRWVFTASTDPTGNNPGLLIAVTAGNDPTGVWHRFYVDTDAGEPVFADGPAIGFTKDWITVSANLFRQDNFDYSGAGIWVFNKASLYAGGAGNFTFFTYTQPGLGPVNLPVPATTYDAAYPTNFLISNWVGNDQGFGFLRVFSISGPVGNEVFNTYGPGGLYMDGAPIGNPPWDDFSPNDDNFAPQLGTAERIYVGDARIQNVVFRNGTIWCTHTVFFLSGGPAHSAVQWWEFTPSANLLQRGRVDDPSGVNFYAIPSIAVNSQNDVVVGYTRFSAGQYPSANYSFHGSTDGPGNLRQDALLKAGEGNWRVADGGLVRWGDWSATVVDPANDLDFWTIQEFASAPVGGTDRWGTWWGRVAPPASLSVGMTGTPITVSAGANVTYTIRATNNGALPASGARITDTLPPGAGFVSATSTRGACGHTNGVVVCDFGPLPAGATATVTLVASLSIPGVATNRVVVSANGPDVSPADNTATVTTTVNTAVDVFPLVTTIPRPPVQGNNFTFAVTVTNRGPSPALGVTLTNTLPVGVSFLSFTTSQGTCARNGSVITCTLGTMNSMTAVNVGILVSPTTTGLLTNQAVVNTLSTDAVPSNNSTSLVTRVDIPPTISSIPNQTIAEDATLGPISFTVADAETPVGSLIVTAYSSDQNLVPNTNIVITGTTGTRTLRLTPAPNANGTVHIFRVVTDADGASATNSFRLNITSANDRPQIALIPAQVIDEDTMLGPLPFTVYDFETPASNLVVTASSSNPGVVPNGNISLSGGGSNRVLTLFPALNQSGSTTISLNVGDGSLSTNRTFTLTVNPVNDLPTLSDLPNRSVNEDASTGAIPFSVGDVETAAGSLVFGIASSNPAILPTNNVTFGGSGMNRTMTVTPAPNQFGAVIVTLFARDTSGGVTNDTFVLTVNPVNDQPTLNALINMSVIEDVGDTIVTLTGISPGGTNENQTLSFTATSSNPALIPNPKIAFVNGSGTGTLTFAPATNANGIASIMVSLSDGAPSNNVIARTFAVQVSAVNDPPFLTAIADQTVNEDGMTAALPFTLGDVDSAIGSLTVSATSSDPALVPTTNITFGGSLSNRVVTVAPAANRSGNTTIQVFASDGLATNVQTFGLTVQPVNDPPLVGAIPTQTTTEDTQAVVDFTTEDFETASDQLIYSAVSSNQKLLPASGFTFGGTGNNRTLRLVPAADQSGSSIIQVNVADPNGASTNTTFVFNVTAANDPPTLATLADLTLPDSAPAQTVPLTGISAGASNETQPISISATSSNPGLIPDPAVTYRSPAAAGFLSFTPVPNATGTAAITVTVRDGDTVNSTFVRAFNVTVVESNDAPVISVVPNQSMNEDGELVLSFTVSDVETQPVALSVGASSSNEELVDAVGLRLVGTGDNRTLTIRPITNQFGSATITLSVRDGGGRSAVTQFELQVLSLSDGPAISTIGDATLPPGAVAPFPFMVGDADTPPNELTVSARSSNPILVPDANLSLTGTGADRLLTLRTAPNQAGTSTITLTVDDGALTGTMTFDVLVSSNSLAPPLRIELAGTNVIVSWTTNAGIEWLLQSKSNDVAAASWSPVGTTPSVAVDRYAITLPATGEARFFRLCQGCGPVEPPMLAIALSNGSVIVTWAGPQHAYFLESRTALDAASAWSPAPEVPEFSNGLNRVTVNATGPARFFRLRTP